MIIIKIPLRPVSMNQMYRVSKSGFIYKTKDVKEWESLARKFIAEQYSGQVLESNVAITLKVCLANDKLIDLDNCLKLVTDCLQGLVIKNDNQVVGLSAYRKMNCDSDKITITITDINY